MLYRGARIIVISDNTYNGRTTAGDSWLCLLV